MADNHAVSAEALARRFLAALEKRDPSEVLALISDDMIMEYPFNETGDNSPETVRRYQGREAIEQMLIKGFSIEESIKFDLESFTSSADKSTVFVEGRGFLLMRGGRSYKNRYNFRFDVRDGKIIRLREYLNPVTSGLAFGRPIAGRAFTDPP